MEYTLLTPRHLTQILRERMLELEADHARASLVLKENPEDQRVLDDLAELERRIGCHRRELPGPSESAGDQPVQ